MTYLPMIELTPQVSMLLSRGALRLLPGQWVRGADGRTGRYLRTNPKTGVNYFSWVRPDDDWESQSQRFHRACVKGYVGRYGAFYAPEHPVPARRQPARLARAA